MITGGSGKIGSRITRELLEKNHEVHYTYCNNKLNVGIEHKLDISDRDNTINLISKIQPNFIIHTAALTNVDLCETDKKLANLLNINGTENILKVAKEFSLKVVYASSSSVYGNPKRVPIIESDDKNPINPYAETKLKKEELAINYAKNGVKVIGLRYFNVFGKGQSNEYAGVLKLFLECIRKKLPPKINGDGTQFRDFVHVNDVVNANIMSMDSKVNHEFFNVGTNTSITILDLAKTIIKSSKLDIKPIFGPALKGDVQETIANIDLIKEKIGWKPTIILKDWINEIITKNKINEI